MNVYKVTNLINSKIYIGQDKHDRDEYLGSGKLIKRAIEKYGRENFSKEILDWCSNQDEMNDREKYWISYYQSYDRTIGYNIALGGHFGDILTYNPNREEICQKMSDAKKGVYDGELNPFFGKVHSDETKAIIGAKNKKHAEMRAETMTPEERKKYGSPGKNHPNFGKKIPDELKQRWSKQAKESGRYIGENNPSYGKRGKLWHGYIHVSDSVQQQIINLYINEQKTMQEIADVVGLKRSKVRSILKEQGISGHRNCKPRSNETKKKISIALSNGNGGMCGKVGALHHAYVQLNVDVIIQIIALYESGYTISNIADELNLGWAKVRSTLLENNVKMRKRTDYGRKRSVTE